MGRKPGVHGALFKAKVVFGGGARGQDAGGVGGTAGEAFRAHRVHIMTFGFEQRHKPKIQILIQLELHATDANVARGMIRSRVISAA
jgi:hypothetical protein